MSPLDLYLLFVVGLIKLAGQFPSLKLNGFFAWCAAFAAWHLSRKRRRLREQNVSETFGFDRREIRRIVRSTFYEFWYEVFSLSPQTEEFTPKAVELRGLENLQEALQKGKGVILWESAFLGRRTLAKRILHERCFLVCQIHSQHHIGGFEHSKSWIGTHVIQRFFEGCERPFVAEIAYLRHENSIVFTRYLLERLKQNAIICITGDGKIGQKFVAVKFLGREELFPTGIANLARLSGASILPLFCVHETRNRARLIIEAPIWIGTDREFCLKNVYSQYVSLLESYIKRYPGQYRNWHQREVVPNLTLR